MTHLKRNDSKRSVHRWGIIVAGENEARPRDSGCRRGAGVLPKQYLDSMGKRSMLEQTLCRAEKLLPAQKMITVFAKEHSGIGEFRRQLAATPPENMIVQPQNRGTGPAILLSLMHLHKRDPAAVVALFPSDHPIVEEDLFMAHVESAFRIVESDGSRIVLLATEPSDPDTQYSYILISEEIVPPDHGATTIEMFVNQPSARGAKIMMSRGALWNTWVFVVTCRTLLQAIQRAAPEMFRSFEPIQETIGTPDEPRVTERVYHKLEALDFCKDVFERLSHEDRQSLRVLPVRGVKWKDRGTGESARNTPGLLAAEESWTPRSGVSAVRNQAR